MVTIVSGLPRCGTSMMMQVLHAGGLPVLTDNIRRPDSDNPKGYYELEKVKAIAKDASWLPEAEGKVFKMVSMLLYELPANRSYKIVFMQRRIQEILSSQATMLKNLRKEPQNVNDKEMAAFFEAHLNKLTGWLAANKNMDVLYCSYNKVIENPAGEIRRLVDFLGVPLDMDKMIAAVDPSLYRKRACG